MNKFLSFVKRAAIAVGVAVMVIGVMPSQIQAGGISAVTYPVTDITANGATFNGLVTYTGNSYNTVFAVGTKSDLSDPVFTYSGTSWANRTLFIRTSTHDLRPTGSALSNFNFQSWSPTGSGSELQPSTTYYVRAGVQTGSDTEPCIWTWDCYSWGSTVSFTTRAAILPTVVTGDASAIGANTATISGSAIANDATSSVVVEYGKSADLKENTLTESGKPSDVMNYCYASDCEKVQAGTTSRSIVRYLTNLETETVYYYRLVARNAYGTTKGEIKSFTTTPSVGLTINNGSSYATSKNVTLSISWPVGATGMSISNDGGFRSGTTVNSSLQSSFSWVLDDSIQGMYPKIVYVRFSGPGIDSSRSYTDDIIFDSNAPVISTTSAEISGDVVAISLAARDDESGLSKVEVNNGPVTVTADYAAKVLIDADDLGLGVSKSSVHKLASVNLRVRISDRAGNQSAWKSLGEVVAPTSQNVVSVSTVSQKSLLKAAKLTLAKGSKLTMKVSSVSSKVCKVSGSRLVAKMSGTCTVKLTVKTKSGKTTSKLLSIKVAR